MSEHALQFHEHEQYNRQDHQEADYTHHRGNPGSPLSFQGNPKDGEGGRIKVREIYITGLDSTESQSV